MAKKTEQELEQMLEPYLRYEGKRLVHFRSQAPYTLREIFLRESDLTVWFSYAPARQPQAQVLPPDRGAAGRSLGHRRLLTVVRPLTD